MLKTLLLLLALGATPAGAQVPMPKSEQAPLQGTWEGPYRSDHGTGGLRLVITRDSVWKATLASAPESTIPESAVENFKIEGTTVSWTHSLMGASCSATAELESGALKGEMSCDHGGTAVHISFLLVRQ